MTQFDIRHGEFAAANDALVAAVKEMGAILDNLNEALKRSEAATRGKALPLWQSNQQQWNQAYADMARQLSSGADASRLIHEVFTDGDNKGASIMG
ncbi:WXG100 family type VII secretion target [Saccharopolyspora sp. NPDC003752]